MSSPSPRRVLARAPVVVTLLILGLVVGLEVVLRLRPEPAPPDLATLAFGQATERELYDRDPDLFWRLKPGLDLEFAGIPLRTNSLGLRGPEPRAPEVLAIGDSVAFGFLVEEEQSWPRRLESRTGAEVLVAAVPGYSSHQGRILLARLLERYSPRYVVISFGYNDARLFPFRDREAAQGRHARLGSLLGRSAVVRRLAGWAGQGRRVEQARQLLVVRARDLAAFPPRDAGAATAFLQGEDVIRRLLAGAPERVPLADYDQNLRGMIRLCRERGARPVLLASPYARKSMEPYFAASHHRTPVAAYRERMQQVSREEGVTYVNIPVLTEGGSDAITRLFVTRRLSEAEQEGFRLLGFDNARQFDMGVTLDLRGRTDLAHPSALGHSLIADALGMVIQR